MTNQNIKKFKIYDNYNFVGIFSGLNKIDAISNYLESLGFESIADAANSEGRYPRFYIEDFDVFEVDTTTTLVA